MRPDFAPALLALAALDDDGAQFDAVAALRDLVAELVVVGEVVHQRAEAADFIELLPARRHHRAKGEVERLERAGLEHLAPEVRVRRHGLPLHRERGRVGERVEAVHEAGLRVAQRLEDLREEVRRHARVGVADDEMFVLREAFEVDEGGDLGVGAELLGAEDELGVCLRVLGDEFADEFADGVFRRCDAKEELHGAAIVLFEPAFQAAVRLGVEALERLEQRDAGGEGSVRRALVQREAARGEPLPERDGEAQERERGEDDVQEHGRFLARADAVEQPLSRKRSHV